MLVALSVRNFKSIRAATVRFGALTCLIGHNGVGKSNLFDAIHLLSALADHDVNDAVRRIRRTADGPSSPLDLLHGRDPAGSVELTADLIVPPTVVDDFEVEATPSTTLLRYSVRLAYQAESDRLVVDHESLEPVKLGDFQRFTRFRSSEAFRRSVTGKGGRRVPFISTDHDAGAISLHGEGGSRGRSASVGRSPLTILGGTNTADYPTVLAAKREMESWRLLHLEPSAMRTPDVRSATPHVSARGGNLPATLRALLARDRDASTVVVNRLRELNAEVEDLDVYTDEVRDQLALRARVGGMGEWLFGRSLSEGTLRYIALALLLVDVRDRAVLCVEEPENGIHPSRVPALVDLLYDYAVDLDEPVADDNPLRQAILNTHSPEVARQVHIDDIVFVERAISAEHGPATIFRPIDRGWRTYGSSSNGNGAVEAQSRQALADFIGGSPIRRSQLEQLELNFGTAR